MELAGKRVVIVGLGKSGASAARLCLAKGASVVGTDAQPLEKLSDEVRALGIELRVGGHDGVDFERADLVVVSPGVPEFEALARAEASGVEVIGEVELASRFLTAPLVAVGGTNGKSTTTTLVADMLRAAGKKIFAGANLGTPSCEAPAGEYDVVVFEVSSFQMERVRAFRPRVALLLNVSEDHLDRYASFQAYADAKGNSFVNQTEADTAVVPAGDPACLAQAKRGRGRVVTFGTGGDYEPVARDVFERSTGTSLSLEGVALHGRHNLENAAAAIAAVRALGIDAESIRKGLLAFRPLGHRMALVGERRGVRFYDDSKGTNVGAAVTALLGLAEEHAVLVAGGRDKLGDYQPLVDALARKGRAAVLIGEAAERIERAIGGRIPVRRAATMEQAVRTALSLAHPGDAVLLSPACSSYDMFKSYAERGDRFAAAVASLSDHASEEEAGA